MLAPANGRPGGFDEAIICVARANLTVLDNPRM
jgi:hypothetical protein